MRNRSGSLKNSESKKFTNIGIGGTFDRLHEGHKLFLDIAAHFGELVHVGVTTPTYLDRSSKKYRHLIQQYQDREENVQNHLLSRNTKVNFSRLDTPGMDRILAEQSDLTALIVSQETCLGAIEINKTRMKNKKPRLTIIICPNITRADGTLESSTLFRKDDQAKSTLETPEPGEKREEAIGTQNHHHGRG